MESVVATKELKQAYAGKNVFVTGHTGFKGSWLVAFLERLGAKVTGYSLAPDNSPNHFSLLKSSSVSHIENILDITKLSIALQQSKAEIIFHLAAQPLVRESYIDPVNTYQTNVIGTLNILQAARHCDSVKSILCITTDKVYENIEQQYAYKETDRLGGYDMYSSSKACCEILISSYRNSFLNPKEYGINHNVLVASGRAGNVIGGGDWSKDRLLPDIIKAAVTNEKVVIRNASSVRPWQHVLDCLYGYLILGKRLLDKDMSVATAWNFSPPANDFMTVADVVDLARQFWNKIDVETNRTTTGFHEATLLQLDSSNSVNKLNWKPLWDTSTSIAKTIEWYKQYYDNLSVITQFQIDEFLTILHDRK